MIETSEVVKMLVLGLAAGVLSGLFGIGGGLVIVPVLVMFLGLSTKSAVGTSLFVILLPTGILGVREYWKNGDVRVVSALWIAVGVFFGAYLGARLAGSLSAVAMKRLYAVFLLVVAVYFLAAPPIQSRREPKEQRPDAGPSEPPSQAVH